MNSLRIRGSRQDSNFKNNVAKAEPVVNSYSADEALLVDDDSGDDIEAPTFKTGGINDTGTGVRTSKINIIMQV